MIIIIIALIANVNFNIEIIAFTRYFIDVVYDRDVGGGLISTTIRDIYAADIALNLAF